MHAKGVPSFQEILAFFPSLVTQGLHKPYPSPLETFPQTRSNLLPEHAKTVSLTNLEKKKRKWSDLDFSSCEHSSMVSNTLAD